MHATLSEREFKVSCNVILVLYRRHLKNKHQLSKTGFGDCFLLACHLS